MDDVTLARGDAQSVTLREWGERWLLARAREGHRAIRTDRSRWRTHVETSSLVDLPLRALTRPMLRAWLRDLLTKRNAEPHKKWSGERPPLLASQTIRNVLNLLRTALEAAVEDELLDVNPARTLRVPRSRTATTRETWTVLAPDEQARLIESTPAPERWIVHVAMGTGLRLGELWSLRLEDVHLDANPYVMVRYGWHGAPTKGGRLRKVPLFGIALLAIDRWVESLEHFTRGRNEHGLLFPTRRGGKRDRKSPKGWKSWCALAGLRRRVRWQDLRHTCASSLVAGWWGRKWTLEEVCQLLGHSSVKVTERYAHFAFDALERAAAESDPSRGPGLRKVRAAIVLDPLSAVRRRS